MKAILCIVFTVLVTAIGAHTFELEDSDPPVEFKEIGCKDGVKNDNPISKSNMPVALSSNTAKQELAPAIKDGILYYIIESDGNLQYYEVELPGVVTNGEQVSAKYKAKPNGKLNDALLNFSLDGKQVFLNVVDEKSSMKKLYTGPSEYMTEINKLKEFPYNSKKYSIGRATVSPDGNRLVFSSGKKGSVGGIDLWLCNRKNASWSYPENIGKLVNTKLNEAMPYFVSDTRLYFASEGHTGYGKYDLYYTDWDGQGFMPPVNMGSQVNSGENEMGICFSEDSGVCYFASDRCGNYDIYSYNPDEFHQVEEIPTPMLATRTEITSDSKSEETPISVYSNVYDVFNSVDSTKSSIAGSPVELEAAGIETSTDSSMNNNKDKMTAIAAVSNPESDSNESVYISGNQFKIGSNRNNTDQSNFYSVQVAAVSEKSYFKQYFKTELNQSRKYFIVREEGWVKIRTNRFNSYREAFKYATAEGIKNFYIVLMNEKQIQEYL